MSEKYKRVGSLHQHALPVAASVKTHDVYRCTDCSNEFYMEADRDGARWESVNDSPVFMAVQYDVHDDGEPEVGRWTIPTKVEEVEVPSTGVVEMPTGPEAEVVEKEPEAGAEPEAEPATEDASAESKTE